MNPRFDRAALIMVAIPWVLIFGACAGTPDGTIDGETAQPSVQDSARAGLRAAPAGKTEAEGSPAVASQAAAGEAGKLAFDRHCMTCHGLDGHGVQGLGISLVDSDLVAARSTQQLVDFLRAGRMPGDANTVSGRSMPGFAWLSEEDLAAISAYIKNL